MRIAIVAPSAVPFGVHGAEKLAWGLLAHINEETPHSADLIKLPSPESNFWEIIDSYRRFFELDLSNFDLVISTKYPSWMIEHRNHVCYMHHKLRGLYDTYALTRLPHAYEGRDPMARRLLDHVESRGRGRDSARDFFMLADELRTRMELSPDAALFPGPLIRAVVHFLDGVALDPRAVRRFAAISENVAGRSGYFPFGVPVDVIHPPSSLKSLRTGGGEYLFTVSRLDGAKRVSLLIEAMRHVTSPVSLKIAGDGPESQALRKLAAGDDRVEFLGYVNDRAVEALYADALAVLYVPYDEDYGLVTLEAMLCAKPVITTTDSGGPKELLEAGKSGFVVPPDPRLVAERIDYLCEHRSLAQGMGRAGRARVGEITWQNTVSRLLDGLEPPRVSPSRACRKITVASSYPIFPAESGGQVRLSQLYGQLAGRFEVDLVSLSASADRCVEIKAAPRLREIRIPMTKAHIRDESKLSKRLDWVPVTDVALPRFYKQTPEYVGALRRSAATADVVVASHPYALPAILEVGPKRIWYEAHNVEFDLKQSILPDTEVGRALVAETRAVEAQCCELSELVFACSAVDRERLLELYEVDEDKVVVVPNGVDVEGTPFVSLAERHRRKAEFGLESMRIAVFLGSWHGPNIDAVQILVEVAKSLPHVTFLIVGSVGGAFANQTVPQNMGFMGVLEPEAKNLVLGFADVGVNVVGSGSGTNLKMLDYCAAGIPVVSTPEGARGLALADEEHIRVVNRDGFGEAIDRTLAESLDGCVAGRTERARALVEERYSWQRIAADFARLIEGL